MIILKKILKSNFNGYNLSRIVAGKLLESDSDEECVIDFSNVSKLSCEFFKDFIYPLTIDFGGDVLNRRLRLINLDEESFTQYELALEHSEDYIDNLYSKQRSPFGDISDISLELILIARELSRKDQNLAQVVFGLNKGMAKFFANMDIESIRRIANAGLICFEPRLSPEFAARAALFEVTEIDAFLNIAGSFGDFYEH